MNHTVRRRLIPDDEFIRAWKACESTRQVADRLGLTVWAVNLRAANLRARGIELPKQEVSP